MGDFTQTTLKTVFKPLYNTNNEQNLIMQLSFPTSHVSKCFFSLQKLYSVDRTDLIPNSQYKCTLFSGTLNKPNWLKP